MEEKKNIRKIYGWYLAVKEIADFTNSTYFEILDRNALEVFSMISIMEARGKLHQQNNLNING